MCGPRQSLCRRRCFSRPAHLLASTWALGIMDTTAIIGIMGTITMVTTVTMGTVVIGTKLWVGKSV